MYIISGQITRALSSIREALSLEKITADERIAAEVLLSKIEEGIEDSDSDIEITKILLMTLKHFTELAAPTLLAIDTVKSLLPEH